MAHFCLKCGTRLTLRIIEGRELEACPACDFILWRNPVVATMVVVEAPAGIVLGRRSIEPGYGLWCLPGGFVNDDEHPEAAAVRECREEIGAGVEITSLLGIYHIVRGDGTGMLGLAYRARLADGETASAGSEMLEVGFFTPHDLPPMAFPSHRQALSDWDERTSVRVVADDGGWDHPSSPPLEGLVTDPERDHGEDGPGHRGEQEPGPVSAGLDDRSEEGGSESQTQEEDRRIDTHRHTA